MSGDFRALQAGYSSTSEHCSTNHRHMAIAPIRFVSLTAVLIGGLLSLQALAQVNPRNHTVRGYYRSNGTYVQPHHRTNPNWTINDNYTTIPNVNPWTGKPGTIPPSYGAWKYPAASTPRYNYPASLGSGYSTGKHGPFLPVYDYASVATSDFASDQLYLLILTRLSECSAAIEEKDNVNYISGSFEPLAADAHWIHVRSHLDVDQLALLEESKIHLALTILLMSICYDYEAPEDLVTDLNRLGIRGFYVSGSRSSRYVPIHSLRFH